jgi:hypothetical protein
VRDTHKGTYVAKAMTSTQNARTFVETQPRTVDVPPTIRVRGEGKTKTKTRKRPTGGTGTKIFTAYIEDDAHCYLPMQVTCY